MRIFKKAHIFFLVALTLFSVYFFSVKIVFASQPAEFVQTSAFVETSGYKDFENASVGSVIAMLIQAFLGFLGIIFVIQMIYAGFSWMTAAGNEDQVKKATALIRRSIIGLIIIVSAYAITYTVFNLLPGAGGGTGSDGGATITYDSSKKSN